MQRLRSKTTVLTTLFELYECNKQLVTYKNVSCALGSNSFIKWRDSYKRRYNKVDMRVIDETLSYRGTTYQAMSGFVLMDNFDKILLQFVQVGLMSKWNIYFSQFPDNLRDESKEEGHSKEFLLRVLVFLIFGYLLAIVAFVFEILCYHCFSKDSPLRQDIFL